VGAKLSDGRRYPALVLGDGSMALPGLLSFASRSAEVIEVGAKTGVATLLDNHRSKVTIEATVCQTNDRLRRRALVDVFANLGPVTVGDADLGKTAEAPLKAVRVGDEFAVPVRVNTGGKQLQFFNVYVHFDPEYLEFVQVAHTIPSSNGVVQFKAGLSDDGSALAAVGTISSTKVTGGAAGVSIFAVTFKAKKLVPATALSGTVVQLLDNTLGSPQVIGSEGSTFEAGAVSIAIIKDGRRRRADEPVSRPTLAAARPAPDGTWTAWKLARQSSWPPTSLSPLPARLRRDNRVASSQLPALKGDANCDGVFDGKDPVFVLNFVAARGNEFSTDLGVIITRALGACRKDNGLDASEVGFMDTDGNTEVTTLDLVYMLDILAGNFYFMSVHVTGSTPDECSFTVEVVLSNAVGGASAAGTQVLLDMTYTEASGSLRRGVKRHPNVVTLDKGSDALFGGLVEALETNPGVFEFKLEGAPQLVTFEDVGVSVIQVAARDRPVVSGTRWKFFGGSPTSLEFEHRLMYPAEALGAAFPIEFDGGFSPLLSGVENEVPDDCKDSSFYATTTTGGPSTSSSSPTTTPTSTPTTTGTTSQTENGTLGNFTNQTDDDTEEVERKGGDGGLPIAVLVAAACGGFFCWICLIFLVVCLRRKRKQKNKGAAEDAPTSSMSTLNTTGNAILAQAVALSSRRGVEEGAAGRSVDPVTGDILINGRIPAPTIAETALPLTNGAAAAQGGVPTRDYMGILGDDDDSLGSIGNLSDFEDADFEQFADSLMADSSFGGGHALTLQRPNRTLQRPGTRKPREGGVDDGDGDDDSLSDFENGESDGDDMSQVNLGRAAPAGLRSILKLPSAIDTDEWEGQQRNSADVREEELLEELGTPASLTFGAAVSPESATSTSFQEVPPLKVRFADPGMSSASFTRGAPDVARPVSSVATVGDVSAVHQAVGFGNADPADLSDDEYIGIAEPPTENQSATMAQASSWLAEW
jgi:hypothetical protein